MAASDFYETLNRLGLSQYHDSLVQEAFDSWDVLADITEEDLDAIGVKLGHRRILQRAIAEYRKEGTQTAPVVELPTEPKHRAAKSDGSISIPTTIEPVSASNGTSRAPTGSKRKYRRHPKPDDNAPDRPPSAYVLFSNQVREHLKGKDLSFTEIAKTVGERWQVLAPDEKATYESRSQAMKDHYYAQLAEYKKTQEYAQYQDYLVDFKAKHEHGNAKRLKEANPSPSRRSSDERLPSSPDNRESSANSSEQQYYERRRSTYDSARILNPVDWRPSTRSGHASPDMSANSMQLEAAFSPRHTKPATTFASINAPPQQTAPVHLKPSPSLRSNGHSASPMQDHPMAISTSMAYGYHPMLAHQTSSDSPPPTMPLGRRPTLPSRQLPLPFPSRQNSISNSQSSLPPMKAPGSPSRFSPPTSGLATLLRAGEHLASTSGDMRAGSSYPDTMNHS